VVRMILALANSFAKGAVVAKHPTGVYLQGSWVQGEQALTFFFSFKKKVSKEKCALR